MPAPEVIAEEIVESLTAALEQFAAVAADLNGSDIGGEVDDAVASCCPTRAGRFSFNALDRSHRSAPKPRELG
jgi:hypothetical protein